MFREGPYLLEMQSFMFSSNVGPRNPITPITIILMDGLALTLLCIAVTTVDSCTNTIFSTGLVARVAYMHIRLSCVQEIKRKTQNHEQSPRQKTKDEMSCQTHVVKIL